MMRRCAAMLSFISRWQSASDFPRRVPHAMRGWHGLIALLLILALCLQAHPQDEPTLVLRGKVLDVHDGDTIKVLLDKDTVPTDVRFHGIDAPELNQSHGPESRDALARLIEGKEVEIEPTGQFSYERMVAIVYVGDVNVNEQMIKDGEAWAARKYLRKREDAEWCAYENSARELKRGLWAQPSSEWIDPREWFYRKKRHYKYTDYSKETLANCMAAIGARQ
jgi:endonuclease YncB( thermonuclease family)